MSSKELQRLRTVRAFRMAAASTVAALHAHTTAQLAASGAALDRRLQVCAENAVVHFSPQHAGGHTGCMRRTVAQLAQIGARLRAAYSRFLFQTNMHGMCTSYAY